MYNYAINDNFVQNLQFDHCYWHDGGMSAMENSVTAKKVRRKAAIQNMATSKAATNTATISLGELRGKLGDVVNRSAFAKERTIVTRHGKGVAAIISIDELELLDELELYADLEALRQARAEDDGTRIKLADFLAEQGLADS